MTRTELAETRHAALRVLLAQLESQLVECVSGTPSPAEAVAFRVGRLKRHGPAAIRARIRRVRGELVARARASR